MKVLGWEMAWKNGKDEHEKTFFLTIYNIFVYEKMVETRGLWIVCLAREIVR